MERRTFSTVSAYAAVIGPNGAYASMMEANPTFVSRAKLAWAAPKHLLGMSDSINSSVHM